MSDSDNEDDCLAMMLGGIPLQDIANWGHDEDSLPNVSSDNRNFVGHGRVNPNQRNDAPRFPITKSYKSLADNEALPIFQFAYKCAGGDGTPDGCCVEPHPLQVVDMSEHQRGNGLVATRPIFRGEVLYTERAAAASQVDERVKACQSCFRSLEGASTCQLTDTSLPLPHLWPILELDFTESALDTQEEVRRDRHGRIQCTRCLALFCTEYCRKEMIKDYGSCCVVTKTLRNLPSILSSEEVPCVQSPISLSVRLFCATAEYFRRERSLRGVFWEGMCGESSDLNALELGVLVDDHYSLVPIYDSLSESLSLSKEERSILSLDLFHQLASISARNGFGLLTQSPFKTYYSGLLRQVGGNRDSPSHSARLHQVAQALGRPQLERGLDRVVESLVAPEIVGLFPLTARVNHSCDPNAQVQSQEFADSRVDVVALRDIVAGEEVTISYIGIGHGVGKKTLARRRRELQAKYLFVCDCRFCT